MIELGVMKTDYNTGKFTMRIMAKNVISVHYNRVAIKKHVYEKVYMKKFLEELSKHPKLIKRDPKDMDICRASEHCTYRPSQEIPTGAKGPLKLGDFFSRVAGFIPENSVVIGETGMSMFALIETFLPKNTKFIGQMFYGSIGFSLGAALGAAVAGKKEGRRVVLFIGDGSFQVGCSDLSTMIRYGLDPIIFLINNDGYTIERLILDGSFNDIQPWKYHLIPKVFGGREGFEVHTMEELSSVLKEIESSKELSFVEAHFERMDIPQCLSKVQLAGH